MGAGSAGVISTGVLGSMLSEGLLLADMLLEGEYGLEVHHRPGEMTT